ncbi:AAA-like domain protein [Gimesia chilikensis]|uniref:AAA-like domain protein n=1 Tax=Gimesia chilikensis TaxID=2605989 RepID=A0A517WAX9_9PLAN|nr:ATP-binding protein [Gimesia chilikensis]QDU02414.1 AAA-like domain protein [Gimesia chilikensis]
MSQGLKEIHHSDVAAEIEKHLAVRFRQMLNQRGPGHCMRASDLDGDLMSRLCSRLRGEVPDSLVFVLTDDAQSKNDAVYITSTKLIELRNPEADGTLRPPLLVFVPNELRTSSEDSFGIATFEDVRLGDVYSDVNQKLIEEIPVAIRSGVQSVLQRVSQSDWNWATSLAVTRFLLTIKVNDYDPDVVGAALYELGLVPDFKLLTDATKAPYRVGTNLRCVSSLTTSEKSDRLRTMDLGLEKRAFRADLANFLSEIGLENPYHWTRQVVCDRSNYRFSFDKWEFEDETDAPDEVFVEVRDTKLPRVGEEDSGVQSLEGLTGELVLPLGRNGLKKFSVSFQVEPIPSKVEGLAKFQLQIISVNNGPTGIVKSVSAWKTNSGKKTVSFNKLSGFDWEEGWHFVRVQAFTEDGERLTLLDRKGQALPWIDDTSSEQTQAPNEGDLFYVVPEGEVEVEPVQRAIPRHPSLLHAQRDLQFTAILDDREAQQIVLPTVHWSEKSRGSQAMIEAKFGSEGTVNIPVSGCLCDIEQRILAEPEVMATWRLSINRGVAGDPVGTALNVTGLVSFDAFLAARKSLFEAIRRGELNLISQGADFGELRSEVLEYAIQFQLLLQTLLRHAEVRSGKDRHDVLLAVEGLLNIDVVHIGLTNYRGQRQQAALIGPLHPIRCLWLAGWSALGESWITIAEKCRRDFVSPARDILLNRLLPANHPPYLSVGHGSVFTAVDNIHPLWTLYAPSLERDARGLIGNVTSALGLPEPDIGGMTVTGKFLASRVQRYLVQHPYVRSLSINAFNPGRGRVLADMLLELQGVEALQRMKYDIRLFVPDANEPGVGENLLELLNPEGSTTAQRADAFSALGKDHLNPKLRIAIRPTVEFRSESDAYPAHVSLLFDVFPAEAVSAGKYEAEQAGAPVYGLLQDFVLDYTDDGETVAWTRQPRHGRAASISGAESITDLLSSLPTVFSAATATVATGQAGVSNRPQVTLALDNEDRALIHQVHDVSDWVFTVDRNIGIEYFDHNDQGIRPDYLIEHTPTLENGLGHQVLVTSRSLLEVEAMMRSVLQRYSLPHDGRRSTAILDSLRCLSGRLALKLIASPNQRAEALGLALAKLYLDHQGIFTNQIVVPLDAHIDLYREPRKSSADLQEEVSLKRTDLALFDLNAAARTITCNLIEVKCYSNAGNLAQYAQLKDSIVEQLETSERVIRLHFDPHLHTPDRIDRMFKTAELNKLLEFYVERSARFGMLEHEVADEARFFIRTLEDGYVLKFTRSAVVFDFEKDGVDESEVDNGVEFHRVGIDVIQTLVNEAGVRQCDFEDDSSSGDLIVSDDGGEPRTPGSMGKVTDDTTSSIPKLNDAAFLASERDRTVDWDSLTSHSFVSNFDDGDIQTLAFQTENEQDQDDTENEQDQDDSVRETVAPQQKSTADAPSLNELEPRKQESEHTVSAAAGVQRSNESKGKSPVKPLTAVDHGPSFDVLLGSSGDSPQYGIIGEFAGRKIALDLNQTHTISLFGVQGGGKSYTLGTVAEMATVPIQNINQLPSPLATVIFHYSPTQDYRPEFTSMQEPNSESWAIEVLEKRFGAKPRAVEDVLLLVPKDKIEERRQEYPRIDVQPLCFSAKELQVSHWQFLMGAVGNQLYMRQLKSIMRGLRNNMTLEGLRRGIDDSSLSDTLKDLARIRLEMAGQYIDDESSLKDLIRPGRLVIVDLRDEFIEKDEALGLFVVLLQLFGDATYEGTKFNKLVVFDEAHKYIDSVELVAGLVEVVREMRHKGTSVMVASQDPPSVPLALIELSTQIILHRFNSPAWIKYIQKANSALHTLTPEKMAGLKQGEAYIWSAKATDESFSRDALKIQCRPRVTRHGGGTKTAVSEAP